MATKFLQPIADILQKYRIQLPLTSSPPAGPLQGGAPTTTGASHPPIGPMETQQLPGLQYGRIPIDTTGAGNDITDGGMDITSNETFDEMWQDFVDLNQHFAPLMGFTEPPYQPQESFENQN